MVRRSSIDEVSRSVKAWHLLLRQLRGTRPGCGLDYRLFRSVPESPPIAKFLRRYVTLREALRRIRVESPNHLPAQKPFINACCTAVLAGLGSFPWNYEEAENRLHEWCWSTLSANGFRKGRPPRPTVSDARPEVAVAAELGLIISGLILAYRDPHRFFEEIAPEFSPEDFDAARLTIPLWLGHTLWRWGFGAFLNDSVRRAFDSATPDQLIEIIGHAEGRERYREGPTVGSGKGKAKKKRFDLIWEKAEINARATEIETTEDLPVGGTKLAIEERAKAQRVTPAAIRKRMTRASNK